ncbi:MAG: IF-2-associated domain-containing protein, partial [Alphaproteobacteria bacterium]|nr:IF-2-associated domain-containing protein [Alphaproteobacteria bacterium]
MTDENDKTNDGAPQAPTGTPSQTGPRAPLSLKPRQAGSVSTGTVRQSFSHGRTKTVVVETKRRPGAVPGHQRPQGFDVAARRPETAAPQAPRPAAPSGPAGGRLSSEEQEARRRAIELATQAQAQRAQAAAAEQARRDQAAHEQAAAAAQIANAAQIEAAAARAAAEAARAEAAKLTAAAPAPIPTKRAPAAAAPTPAPAAPT